MKQQPGMIQKIKLEKFGPKELEISHNLSTVWFLTNASIQSAGKDKYPYLFMKPTDELREKFPFFGDVLAVFHPYPTVDGRVLDAIEKILSANQNRLDRLCVILITNATAVDEKISSLNSVNEARVIVPFKYQELSSGPKGKHNLVVEKLTKYLFTRDLFAISSALKTDRYFFGRKEDVQYLIGKYQTGENSTVFGLRRIGKTSVLWAVYRELSSSGVPVAVIDCSDPKFHKSTWNKTLFRIVESIYEASGGVQGHVLSEGQYTEQDASMCFARDLAALKAIKNKAPLLILDEVESLTFDLSSSDQWRSGQNYLPFWQTLRSVYQQNPGLFSFCLCGVNPRVIEAGKTNDGADNPLYRYVEARYLGFFRLDDVQAMIEHIGGYMGMAFDKEIYTYLTDEFGGHPFLIRQASSFIYKKLSVLGFPRKIEVKKQVYNQYRDEVWRSLYDYVALILSVLRERYIDEYNVLKYLSVDQVDAVKRLVSHNPSLIQHLIGYGLIIGVDGDYHFRINVVRDTLRDESKSLRVPDTVEGKWALLSELRNPLEVSLRGLVKRTLKISLGEEGAKHRIIEAMKKQQQKKNAEILSYQKIFSSEIYFSDLRRVVENDWDVFARVFGGDKEKFTSAMIMVNKYRADAHASEISVEDFSDAMSSMNWLTACVEEYV